MSSIDKKSGPAVWAGLECTINRVLDQWNDQAQKNGHDQRENDLAQFTQLGLERIRYPFLWEKATSEIGAGYNWDNFDRQADQLQELSLIPIAGLLHHGSGPAGTQLLDPDFAKKFADYAFAFSSRYPWIKDYTPVNEPLTTARFSALYGVWYPHARDDASFVRALFNQVEAVKFAMKSVREINPDARLIQTEDLGQISGTPDLQYQINFENHRRWLSFDLLCGLVKTWHPLYKFLRQSGLSTAELERAEKESCTPDLIGINHYILSNRFLDSRLDRFPAEQHGGNRFDTYADVGTIHIAGEKPASISELLRDVWDRYHLPIAVTEAHAAGPPETRMRWLNETWQSAKGLREEGIDIRAVTAWSLLGSFDWNSLCTRNDSFYEPGVFDIRSPVPRPTALAPMIEALAHKGKFDHPLLDTPGWWTRGLPRKKSRPLIITGALGTLARAFARICEAREIEYIVLNRDQMDIANLQQVEDILETTGAWALINAAGYVKVDQAETEPERCFRENVLGPETLARACALRNIRMMTFSSDLVFDGQKQSPYLESHPVSPMNVYGNSKAKAEVLVSNAWPEALIIRTSSFFGPWDEFNFVTQTLRDLQAGQPTNPLSDVWVSPTYVPDLVDASLDLLIDGEKGVFHLTNQSTLTWSELAQMAAQMGQERLLLSNRKMGMLRPQRLAEMPATALRPPYSVLRSEKLELMPTVENALSRYFGQLEISI